MSPIVPPQAGTHRRTAGRPVKRDQAARTASRRRLRTMEANNAIARWVNEGGGGGEVES
jgi:hypothetical protein